MGGIDKIIASSLSLEIKKKLNSEILKKVERELFFEYGMSIKLSVENFHKFLSILKKNSSIDTNRFEKDCISKILKVKIKNDKFLVTVIHQHLRDLIIEFFGDIETRKIITALLEKEYTIPQILKESKIPKTSGYRKIKKN